MLIYHFSHFKAILKWQIKYVFEFVVSICCLQKNIVFNIFQKWFIFFQPIIIKRRNTSMELAKIKSHFRHRSQQDSIRFNIKNTKSSNIEQIAQKINLQPLNLKSSNETVSNLNKFSKRFQFQQIKSLRNSVDYNRIDKMSSNKKQNQNFQKQLKRFQESIQDFQISLSSISKRTLEQKNKNNLLSRIIQMIKIQIQSQPVASINLAKHQSIKDDKQLILKEKQQIQKIANSHNTNLSINKTLIEQIQNQRKFRILYETYFYSLQKQIKKHEIIYYTFLVKSLQNKFLYFVISDNDIVSNGHVLGFKKQSSEENQKDMMRNTYMCLPTKKELDQDEDKNSYKRKSSKCIDKKGKIKKLVKILNFVQTSKALQSSQLSLYEQQQLLDNSRGRIFSSFRTQHEMFNFPTNNKESLKKKILGNSSKYRQRSAKLISIKFISHMNTYYESEFDEIVYEIFRLYQQLGINIFAQPSTQDYQSKKFEDFFHFDEQRLISESQRRIQFVRMSLEKTRKFNQALDKKIVHINQNIIQTEQFKDQLQKRKKKQQQSNYCEIQQKKSTIQGNLNEKTYLDVLQLLQINPMDFNSEKQIQLKIQKLIQMQKQQKQLKKQNPIETINDDGISSIEKDQNAENQSKFFESSKLMNSKQSLLHTINSLFEPTKTRYAKGTLKTEGFQRKFHKLIKHQQQDNMSKTSKLNQTSRSIFQNGMKSLDNIFGNMKTCQSYKRAFMREQFQKQYTKEITKKKRVMFRRQAKVLPSFID